MQGRSWVRRSDEPLGLKGLVAICELEEVELLSTPRGMATEEMSMRGGNFVLIHSWAHIDHLCVIAPPPATITIHTRGVLMFSSTPPLRHDPPPEDLNNGSRPLYSLTRPHRHLGKRSG